MYIAATEAKKPLGHLEAGDTTAYSHVLYDAESYSYDTILKLLRETPGNNLRLATYSTATGNLITEDAIYTLKNE